MANLRPIQCQQVSCLTTADTVVNLGGVQRIMLRAQTHDIYVDFDQPTATSQSYLVQTANTADTTIDVPGGNVQNLYARGSGGTGTLFIIAIVN